MIPIIANIAAILSCIAIEASTLKLADAPLSQVIELYSRETGKNVFLDDTVQQNRRVNAYLQGMNIEQAFSILQKTVGLESMEVSTGTLLIFPPERASRYRPVMKAFTLRIPFGLDAKWLANIIVSFFPTMKTAIAPENARKMLLFGPENQEEQLWELSKTLPEISCVERFISMTEGEAALAAEEMKTARVAIETGKVGVTLRGPADAIAEVVKNLEKWRIACSWGSEVFTPRFLDASKALKAAESAKYRNKVSDLGGTGSLLVEGPLKGEVSSVVATTKQGYPQIRTRESESILRISDGGSVIMSGLLSREEREQHTRIPIVGNIPLFGGLARGRDRNREETEIIMIVSAKLVGD